MDTETVIILLILAAFVVIPIVFVKLWHRPSRFMPVGGDTTASHKQQPDLEITKAEILNEICNMQSGFTVTRLARGKELSQAEINILQYKANPFRSGAFRVMEKVNEDEINKWLNHPMINHPMPDSFVMSMAAQTPIPVKMMERILRTLLQEDYEMWWEKAEARVRSKKWTS